MALDHETRERLQRELLEQLRINMHLPEVQQMPEEERRLEFRAAAEELCQLRGDILTPEDRQEIVDEVLTELFDTKG